MFDGDVDQDHKLTLPNCTNQQRAIFESGTFAFDEPSNDPVDEFIPKDILNWSTFPTKVTEIW